MADPPRRATDTATQSFSVVYETHYPAVFRYCIRLGLSSTDAQDVAQQVFAVAWRRISVLLTHPEIDDMGNSPRLAWLLSVTGKMVLNHRRGLARGRDLRLRAGQMFVGTHSQSADSLLPGPAMRAFVALADRDRDVLRLSSWDGLTASDIGRVLNCSENAAALRLSRARQRFRAALAAEQTLETTAERAT